MRYPIHSITPFTTLDYPDEIAAIAWFAGCNMRCAYCYNVDVVMSSGSISGDEFCKFLNKRVGKLSGIVFSGGECTLNTAFLPLAREVKQRGFLLKVDTNGSNLHMLKTAIDDGLIDYIALDFKALKHKFKSITGSNLYDKFIATLEFLLSIKFKFEVRTTLHFDLLDESDISQMAQILRKMGYEGKYFLQKFLDTGSNFGSLNNAKNSFDIEKIISPIPIKLRNF
ncbi:anaerobic ribonucleoside-triphosphate reductase activating protein [Campylobacter sp. faydin G-105]|uniref:anaerobic ribonucleoside-triphosphate reductase activating protein n=1 Tax=Campylobacter anatolicus TaxID=2829105 RepID=UPI001BA3C625|nr:anaerobic ribonucleoside-triphosphate reductase activating protein [Campylobacter anatolicus]MBR8461389.1 anaerobic ribonucleoside-triphosphate reductase activating protein [Campylobacter anatolicus]